MIWKLVKKTLIKVLLPMMDMLLGDCKEPPVDNMVRVNTLKQRIIPLLEWAYGGRMDGIPC
jgi:hypothetical protein